MKTFNLLSGFRKIVVQSLVLMVLVLFGCGKDDPDPVAGEVEVDLPEFALVNVAVTLTDKSNNAASRSWTIQDATPSTSTDKAAEVVFNTSGSKTITLDVVFENGTKNSKTFTLDVAAELNGTFSSVETVSWAPEDKDITISVAFTSEVVGSPDGYSWSFPGGTPATSTEANPTVVWMGGGTPTVSLTLSRAADAASLELTEALQVGPVNLFTNDFWGFEADDVIPNLQTWDGDNAGSWASGVVTALSSGYDGKAIEVNYPGNTGYYGMISRDKTPSNAELQKGDIVLFSFYAKASVAGSTIGFSRIVNHCPSWWEGNPPPGFEGFVAADGQDYQVFANVEPVELPGTDWTRVSVIDTLSDLNYSTARNVFPEVGFSGAPVLYSFDKFELKVLGNNN